MLKCKLNWLTVFFFCFAITVAKGQFTGRITGDLVSKEKNAAGRYVLNSGKFYYDTQIKQLIYQIRFPQPETVVMRDTVMYHFRNQKLFSRIPNFAVPEASIFHLSLMGRMKDFGLKNSQYTVEKVEKEADGVYITWKPVAALANTFGRIKIAQRNNRLIGVVFFDKNDKQIAKQTFRNYTNVNGIDIPQEVIMVSTQNGKPYYLVTTYKNIVVNDFKDTKNYRVDLPR